MTGAPTLTYDEILVLLPCGEAFRSAVKLLGGREQWRKNPVDAATAVEAGIPHDDILWVCLTLATSNMDVERRLRLWAVDCAARVLHFYERIDASYAPRNTVIAARQFARGEIDRDDLAAVKTIAWRARGNIDDVRADDLAVQAAKMAAKAAMLSASALPILKYADWAAVLAVRIAQGDANAAEAAEREEEQWQRDRLVMWMSDDEPEDWPLPERNHKNERRR